MKTPHKWAEVIKAWADGETVQWKHYSWGWTDITPTQSPDFVCAGYEWRIKPKTVKYRVGLWQFSYGIDVHIFTYNDKAGTHPNFIRWIDPECKEVDI